jgi:hypothetical protein
MTRLAPDRTAVDASNFFTPALTSAGLPKSGPDPKQPVGLVKSGPSRMLLFRLWP